MSFKNLEERYLARVDQLYAGAKTKFDDGRPSTGANHHPILVRGPGDGQPGLKLENRQFPFVSAPRDLKRLFLFQTRTNGILFLAKQALLQSQNTYAVSTLLNPAFVLGNVTPYAHVSRHLKRGAIVQSLLGLRTKYESGILQERTYLQMKENYKSNRSSFYTNITSNINAGMKRPSEANRNAAVAYFTQRALYGQFPPPAPPKQSLFSKLINRLTSPIRKAISKITGPVNAALGGEPGLDRLGNAEATGRGVKVARPEIDTVVAVTTEAALLYQRDMIQTQQDDAKNADRIAQAMSGIPQRAPAANSPRPFIKYFRAGDNAIRASLDGELYRADPPRNENFAYGQRLSYVKDPSNLPEFREGNVDRPYNKLPTIENNTQAFDDIITVSFAMGADQHVQFRAYITDLVQSVSPEYREYQYIGRIEKFVNYTGVKREVSFKMHVVANSQEELPFVWRRVNFLTGLAYPYGFNRGILQPNVTRMTIGGVYIDQPAILTSLSTNFNETAESWDIDYQVPIAATMDMKFTLFEKATRIARSPFYGITENLSNSIKGSNDAFDMEIQEVVALKPNEQSAVERAEEAIRKLSSGRNVTTGVGPAPNAPWAGNF